MSDILKPHLEFLLLKGRQMANAIHNMAALRDRATKEDWDGLKATQNDWDQALKSYRGMVGTFEQLEELTVQVEQLRETVSGGGTTQH